MDNAVDALRYVNNPYALIGLTLVVIVGAVVRYLGANKLDLSTRRVVSLGLLVLGGIVIIGSLSLLPSARRRPEPKQQNAIDVHGDGNVVGNGNAVINGLGNTLSIPAGIDKPASPTREHE